MTYLLYEDKIGIRSCFPAFFSSEYKIAIMLFANFAEDVRSSRG